MAATKCAALKADVDAAKIAGSFIDEATKAFQNANCRASALLGSIAAVALAIFTTVF